MSVLVVGLSHRSAPVEVLERAAVAAHELPKLLDEMLHAGHVIPAASSWTAVSDSLPPDAVDEHGYVKVNAK